MSEPSPEQVIRWVGMTVAAEPPTSRRMVAAKQANRHLFDLVERQHADEREQHLVGFLCECGCMDTATLTAVEYEAAGGAWCAGHKPT